MMQTNPKDLLGLAKAPLGLLPAAGKIVGAMAMAVGARKYGPYNWRDKAVKYTIYLDAIERHLLALRDGEDYATDSKVHHLGHIIACAAIVLDAWMIGKLVDDRPGNGPGPVYLKEAEDYIALYSGVDPRSGSRINWSNYEDRSPREEPVEKPSPQEVRTRVAAQIREDRGWPTDGVDSEC